MGNAMWHSPGTFAASAPGSGNGSVSQQGKTRNELLGENKYITGLYIESVIIVNTQRVNKILLGELNPTPSV